MDGYRPTAALGILYAEDFELEPAPAPPRHAAPLPPALTQSDIDAACIRAVQAAQTAWSRSADERRAEALGALGATLAEARESATRHAEAVAEGIAQTALGMLAGALPHLCRTHGDTEVRALLQHLAPLVAPRARLVVRVHDGLVDTLRADMETLDDLQDVEIRPANLPPGDVRLAWEDGGLVRDSAVICAAMRDGLAQLGLIDPTLPPRSSALAQ